MTGPSVFSTRFSTRHHCLQSIPDSLGSDPPVKQLVSVAGDHLYAVPPLVLILPGSVAVLIAESSYALDLLVSVSVPSVLTVWVTVTVFGSTVLRKVLDLVYLCLWDSTIALARRL
jgi:hypothetical protein